MYTKPSRFLSVFLVGQYRYQYTYRVPGGPVPLPVYWCTMYQVRLIPNQIYRACLKYAISSQYANDLDNIYTRYEYLVYTVVNGIRET